MRVNLYELPIEQTLKTAWEKTKGAKSAIWIAQAIVILCVLAFALIFTLTLMLVSKEAGALVNIIGNIFLPFLHCGLLYIGIERAQDKPISYNLIFKIFESALLAKTMGVYVIQIIAAALPSLIAFMIKTLFPSMPLMGLILMVAGLITIYLLVRMILAIAFVLDKNLNPWAAVKASFKATRGNFWKIFFLYFIFLLLFFISSLPLGIGLIWTVPLGFVLYGTLYQQLLLNNYSQ